MKLRYWVIYSLWLFTGLSIYGDRNETGSLRLMEGPMLGAVTEDSILIWARFSGPYPVSLEIARDSKFEETVCRIESEAMPENDYCVEFKVDGLRPGTSYFYRFYINGQRPKYYRKYPSSQFQTAPNPRERSAFSVGMGSCARYQEDPLQTIWLEVYRHQPDLFFWLGDNIYGDSLDGGILAEEYRRQRAVPYLQPVNRTIPQLATWDDHDFGLNDHDRTNPVKEKALEIFKRYWANPAYGLPETPGVFFDYHYGGIDFFFLDGRYYRDPYFKEDNRDKTLLGEAQLSWLKDGLLESEAPFKVLVCGSGWTSLKGPGGDSWSSMLTERDALFEWITENGIEGVVLVSGDVHRSELNIIPWSEKGGYDFYEFVASPLAQGTSTDLRPDIWEIYYDDPVTDAPSFGLLEFDLTRKDPEIRYRVIDGLGHEHYENFSIRASDLKPGVISWTDKVGKAEIGRHAAFLERMKR